MSSNRFDVIVIGTGSMGSAACYFLAAQGLKVLGLDQYKPPHSEGSHSGQSRIVRKAYFEHPDYVPLLNRAYELWDALEKISGKKIVHKTGILYAGPGNHIVLKGVLGSSELYHIPVEDLSVLELQSRFPAFSFPDHFRFLFEPDAGYVRPGEVIHTYVDFAKRTGCLFVNEKVIGWKNVEDLIEVATENKKYTADKLVITPGAWAGKLIPDLNQKFNSSRQVLIWIDPAHKKDFESSVFPCWMIADDLRESVLYGFPWIDKKDTDSASGVKLAWHSHGNMTDPDKVAWKIDNDEIEPVIKMTSAYIPGLKDANCVAASVCLYENTPDENFIIDHLPGYNNKVVVACGFSGHGFKFVPVVGEIIKDLVLKGSSDLPIEFLRYNRFQYRES